jgi:hypothetical protein
MTRFPVLVTEIHSGHDDNGKAMITSDTVLTPANPLDPEGRPPPKGIIPGFTNLYKTDGIPAKAQTPFVDVHGKKIGLVDQSGVFCRIVDFPATGDTPDDVNIMHRTQSVDFGVVLKGSIKLILDDGVETLMKEGDVCVQRATIHVSSPAYLHLPKNMLIIGHDRHGRISAARIVECCLSSCRRSLW